MGIADAALAAIGGGTQGAAMGIQSQITQSGQIQDQAIKQQAFAKQQAQDLKDNMPVEIGDWLKKAPPEAQGFLQNKIDQSGLIQESGGKKFMSRKDLMDTTKDITTELGKYEMTAAMKGNVEQQLNEAQKAFKPLQERAQKIQADMQKELEESDKTVISEEKIKSKYKKLIESMPDQVKQYKELSQAIPTLNQKWQQLTGITTAANKFVEKALESGASQEDVFASMRDQSIPENKAAYERVHNAIMEFKNKDKGVWSEPKSMKIGNKTAMVQENSLTGEIKPVIQSSPTTIVMPSKSEEDIMAKMLAEGKITLSDISKRGGIAQQAKILKKASEINADLDPRADQAATQAFASAISQQQKQIGAMGSFVKNMEAQVDKVKTLSKKLETYDTRILNLPLRSWRGTVAGSADQAKYDMYITEIENEIGKLATGSAASIAELSVGAQEKWAKIHDKNLSVKDMISLLEETKQAGKMRMKSVEDQLKETKDNMRNRGKKKEEPKLPEGLKAGW